MERMESRPFIGDDRGMAMVAVVLLGTVLMLLAAVVFIRTTGNYNAVFAERSWERTIHVADAGIDHGLFLLLQDPTYTTGEVRPAALALEDEEAWARLTANQAVALDPTRAVHTPEGDWVIIKPVNAAMVYSVGYVPTYAAARNVRVVAVSYDFAPFAPTVAVMSGGDIAISGSANVAGTLGNIHANGDITITGGGTLIAGFATASGTMTPDNPVYAGIGDPANSGGSQPARDILDIDPRDAYELSEYDLCPKLGGGGEVRTGPLYTAGPEAPNLTGVPCMGTLLGDASGSEYRGWKWTGTDAIAGQKWDYVGNTTYDGVYFLHEGSAVIGGNPGTGVDPWDVTLLVSAAGVDCFLIGGDIRISGNPVMRPHQKGQPLLLVAQRDLQISGNPAPGDQTYTGVIVAGEQFKLNGNPTVTGVIIAVDACDTPGSDVNAGEVEISGNPTITYDGGLEIPLLGTRIRITQWNET